MADGSAGEADALERDAADPLSAYRERFLLPVTLDGKTAIYLAGQSLGLQPKTARAAIDVELDAWARLGVDAWFTRERPWFTYTERLREPMARVVGARTSEVAVLNGLTVNIHLLLASFFRPDGRRRRILADGPLFPSDRHALTSHLAQRGLDPDRDLVVVEPPAGTPIVPTERLEAAIREHAAELALVFLSGVNFATGQLHDIERLTAAGREAGALVGWDLAHAAGNVELTLHDWDVDFAAWCTYKYLNGGPGSAGGIFVHDRHGRDPSTPRLGGWWGIEPDRRFDMTREFVPAPGAAGWEASTSSALVLAPLAASLAIFDEAGMPALRARSVALTGYLASLLAKLPVEVITPADPAARGSQLSLRFDDAEAVLERLVARGVVADFRAPDLIRVAPTALYNTYHEAWRFATLLRELR
ncbi:MAG TPA: kynureninase [Candidatus Limnocylindrales bacterium]|nr:kynureninase [Candidatus Limnocylindrales bacterium]